MAKGGKTSSKSSGKGKGKGSKKSNSKKDESEAEAESLLWEENIKAEILNDGKWKCNVTILTESRSEDTQLIEWFEDGAKAGSRPVIKNIANADLVLELKLSHGKKGMTKSHPLQGVCSAAAKKLSGDRIPAEILAQLLKYKIIRLKEADLMTKRLKVLEEIELQKTVQRMMEDENNPEKSAKGGKKGGKEKGKKGKGKSDSKGSKTKEGSTKGGKDKKKEKGGKKGKGKKKGKDEDDNECWEGSNLALLETPEKYNTKLAKRGDTWKAGHRVDDAPKEGADLYVVLTGFYDPNLLIELVKIGVPVNAVIRLKGNSDGDSRLTSARSSLVKESLIGVVEEITAPEEPPKRNASMLVNPCGKDKKKTTGNRKGATSLEEKVAHALAINDFWTELKGFNRNIDNLLLLKDVSLANFPAPQSIKTPANADDLLENQNVMYDTISLMLYELERFSRQHINYIRHLKLLNVEETEVNNTLEGMDVYKTMVQLMPMECHTTSFILNCMLEQVVTLCQEEEVIEILTPQELPAEDDITFEKTPIKEESSPAVKKSQGDVTASKAALERSASKESGKSRRSTSTSKDESPILQARTSEDKTTSFSGLEMSLLDIGKVDEVQSSLDEHVKQLNKEYRLFQVPSPRVVRRDPLVMLYRDLITQHSFHVALPEVDLTSIFVNIVKYGKVSVLWNRYKEQTFEEKLKHDFHIHQLWECMEEHSLTLRMLKHHIHILIIERMRGNKNAITLDSLKGTSIQSNLDISGANGFMEFTDSLFKKRKRLSSIGSGFSRPSISTSFQGPIQTPLSEPFERKSSYQEHRSSSRQMHMESIGELFESPYLANLSDPLTSLVTGCPPIKERGDILDLHKYTFVEEMNPSVLFQTVFFAQNNFNVCDVQYFAPTDVLLLNFHNSNDSTDLVKNMWMAKLTTPVSYRDFCEFVYEEETQWLKQQEIEYEIRLKENKEKEKHDMQKEKKAEGIDEILVLLTVCADQEFIKAGSIKHNEILKKEQGDKIEEDTKGKKKGKGTGKDKSKTGSEKKEKKEKKNKSKKEKSSKGKKESSAGKSEKKKKKGKGEPEAEIEVEIPFIKRPSLRCAKEDEEYSFLGYDLGPIRFQIDGKSARYFSPDGTDVKLEISEWIYTNRKQLKTSIQKRGHTLYVYSIIDFDQPKIETPFVFHVVSQFQCILAFGESQFFKPVRKLTFAETELNTVGQDLKQSSISKVSQSKTDAGQETDVKPSPSSKTSKSVSKVSQSNMDAGQETDVKPSPSSKTGKSVSKVSQSNMDAGQETDVKPSPSSKTGKSVSKVSQSNMDAGQETDVKPSPSSKASKSDIRVTKKSKTKQSDIGLKPDSVLASDDVQPDSNDVVEPSKHTDDEDVLCWQYDFSASWPSGLIFEIVRGSSILDPFHCKQKYLQKGPECAKISEENYRLFLRNGTVLKFLTNGFVEVLCPDSTITLCRDFKRPEKNPEFGFPSRTQTSQVNCPEDAKIFSTELNELITVPSNVKNAENKIETEPVTLNEEKDVSEVPFQEPPPTEIVDYYMITPSGTQFSMKEKVDPFPNLTAACCASPYLPIQLELDDNYERFLLRRATDYELGEVFTRRGDGTNTLLMPDGRLIVVYPDGTRITSSYTIEEEPVFLEWTEEEMMAVMVEIRKREQEELARTQTQTQIPRGSKELPEDTQRESLKAVSTSRKSTLTNKSKTSTSGLTEKKEKKQKQKGDRKSSAAKQTSKQSKVSITEDSGPIASTYSNIIAEETPPITIDPELFCDDEGFVLIHLDCCLEHPNYATVSYVGRDSSAVVDMPHNMSISITSNGLYTVNVDNQTQLQVVEDLITFKCFPCPNCTTLNESTINLAGFREFHTDLSDIDFCRTTDGWGNLHTISYLGGSSLGYIPTECAEVKSDEVPFTPLPPDIPIPKATGTQCLPPVSKYHQRQCFVIHRDLTGAELIHQDDARANIQEVTQTNGAAAVMDRVPNHSGLQYHTLLVPIPQTYSQTWLMDYKSRYILPHSMRKKHLRSTYGDPPCWYHPFPKRQTLCQPLPEDNGGYGDAPNYGDMTLRILQEMQQEESGENIITAIQEGLSKYWKAASEMLQEFADHLTVDQRPAEVVEIEDELLMAALGQATVSVPDLFRRARQALGPTFSAMERLQTRVSAHKAYLQSVLQERERAEQDKEDYKSILRNKSIPPYFQSISGESFLRVVDAVDLAVKEVEEEGENIARSVFDDILENKVGEAEEQVYDILDETVRNIGLPEEDEPDIDVEV